jgi:probable F420-dependent oxidoreductase
VSIKLGVNLPQATPYALATDVPAFAREAERIGYDSVWVLERLLTPLDQSGEHGLYGVPGRAWPELFQRVLDPVVAVAQAAAVTSRIALGTGVLVPPMHSPVQLAKTVASLDTVAGGRLIAGFGAGWSPDEFAAAARGPYSERGKALDEFLDTAAALWSEDPVSYEGSGFSVLPSYFNPKPHGKIPIFLGGDSKAAFRRIAQRKLGWVASYITPDHVGPRLAMLREQAERDVPCIVQVAYFSTVEVPMAGREPFTGSLEQLTEDVVALADAGVDHAYVTLPYAAGGLDELIEAAEKLHALAASAGLVG